MKKVFITLLTLIMLGTFCTVNAVAAEGLRYVIDEANLLTEEQETALNSRFEKIKKEYDVELVVLTVESIGDMEIADFADDYYDYNGYGEDGALLLVSVEDGRYVSTTGSCIDAIDVDELGSEISDLLDDEDYVEAFNSFADYYEAGKAFKFGKSLIISIVIGLIIAFIVTSSMKGKLNSVRMQSAAANYVKVGSFDLSDSRDIFLYRHVTRRERPKSNNSSTHTSSSGRTHGGGRI